MLISGFEGLHQRFKVVRMCSLLRHGILLLNLIWREGNEMSLSLGSFQQSHYAQKTVRIRKLVGPTFYVGSNHLQTTFLVFHAVWCYCGWFLHIASFSILLVLVLLSFTIVWRKSLGNCDSLVDAEFKGHGTPGLYTTKSLSERKAKARSRWTSSHAGTSTKMLPGLGLQVRSIVVSWTQHWRMTSYSTAYDWDTMLQSCWGLRRRL